MKLVLQSLTVDKLDVFKELLGSSEFGGCFCAVWTSYGDDWIDRCKDRAQPNFLVTKKNVEAGKHVGFLVYDSNDLIGWTGSGPKTDFPFLKTKLGSRLSSFSADIWSVGCLAVKEAYRGKGIADFIVSTVVEEAKKNNAKIIEAYPTRPFHEPRLFRGTYQLYARLGFTEVSSEKDGDYEIVLMSLDLGTQC
jgi:GNAT superfamily N-acetyltransferase